MKKHAVFFVLSLFFPVLLVLDDKRTIFAYDMAKLFRPALYENSSEATWDSEVIEEARDGDYSSLALLENEQMQAMLQENQRSQENAEPVAKSDAEPVAEQKVEINYEKLNDFDYLCQNYYTVDRSTTITSEQLNAAELIGMDLTICEETTEPTILIYHTHSQEGYADSTEGDSKTSVMAVGEYLTQLLQETYGFAVIHHTGEYDVGDRDHAYTNAALCIEQLLAEHPSIQVVIDLHRDSVGEQTHLVTEIDGKPTAKIMFFNGLCKTNARGELEYLQNPYLKENLAFSLQMQIAAAEYYPDFTRHIYLKGYRYNMHFCPKTLLVEVGAQNNSLEEAKNAMEPLASLLEKVLRK